MTLDNLVIQLVLQIEVVSEDLVVAGEKTAVITAETLLPDKKK